MRRPSLGPKAKASNQKSSKRSWMQRRRAEERFEARNDGSSSSDEESEVLDVLGTPEVVPVETSATPQCSRPKRMRTAVPRNLEHDLSAPNFGEDLVEDPYNTMSDKDDSEFGTDVSLSDNARDSDAQVDQGTFPEESHEESSTQESIEDSSEDDGSSQDSDAIDDTVQNPLLYPPSQPIPYDRVVEGEDPKIEFFRAVTSIKVRHEVSDAAIDDLIKVRFLVYFIVVASW